MATGVKILLKESDIPATKNFLLSEVLRYAGVITVAEERDYETGLFGTWLKIYTPKGVDFKIWSGHQVGRMASFGYKTLIFKN